MVTKIWLLMVRLVSSQAIGKPKLYSYQRSLPSLPVPPLKDTCRRVRYLSKNFVCVFLCAFMHACVYVYTNRHQVNIV